MPRALAVLVLAFAACPAPAAPGATSTTGLPGSTSSTTLGSTTAPAAPTTSTATSSSTTTTTTSTTGTEDGFWYDDVTASLPGPSTTGQTMEARAADLDGDGDLDLVLAKEWQPNALLLNDGTGQFSDASDRIPQAIHDHEDIAIADFDGDGDLDVVVASEDDAAKELYLNDGKAQFVDASDRLPQLGKSNAVAAADIDGDGDLDLVFGCDGAERVLVNDGAAVFSDESAVRIAATTDVTQDVALADLDGDGDLDLVLDPRPERLVIHDGGRALFVPLAEIDWIEAAGKYVVVHAGGASHVLRESISTLEAELDPHSFARIHRSTIVRIERIREVRSLLGGDYEVVLRDGTALTTSRGHRHRVQALLGRRG